MACTTPGYPAVSDAVAGFIEEAQRAFAGVADEHGLALASSTDTEWYAMVEWDRGDLRLRVADDRRDNVTEVFVSRPADDDDRRLRHIAVRDKRLELPLWAATQARGDKHTQTLLEGDAARRLTQLSALAATTGRELRDLLNGDWGNVDAIVAVVQRRHEEDSEEGRRRRRWLP